jgi:ABC-type multidrug transport system ATPase subunit
MKIEEYADKFTKGYSGGNKRKLSLAIALIANPPILFLDEPTTGMDPVSRRYMWNLISEISKDRAVVLTSHFMEECDALCTRIGILNRGKLKCLGSSQHLKSRFGRGYNVEIKLKPNAVYEELENFMSKMIQGAALIENHELIYRYEVPQVHHSLAEVFEMLENYKEKLGIEDYSISQTTLEQIFLRMSKEETNDHVIDIQ